MNTTNRLLVIGFSLFLMVLILIFVKEKKLKEKYAILWLISGGIILMLSIFTGMLNWITSILGIVLPSNAVFFFGILFIILINLHFSLVISNLSENLKNIAQKLALLEFNLSNKKHNE